MQILKRFLRFIFLGGCLGNLVGFLLLSFLIGGCYTLIVLTVSQNTKNSEPYQIALRALQESERAGELLGEPLSEGWIVTENIEMIAGVETASLIIPVYGAAQAGTVYASVVRDGDSWQVDSLFLDLNDDLIDLWGNRETQHAPPTRIYSERRHGHIMRQYLDLMAHILENGVERGDRTGVGTISVFGYQMRFDLAAGFPLLTTKKLHLRSIIHELLWFLKGESNIAYLHENRVKIWDEWADENGELGPVYGVQWRAWPTPDGRTIDQISTLIEGLRQLPYSRRHIVSAWNVGDVEQMALPPCHCLFQFYVAEGRLSCQLYQRSADIFLGVPFNIASYALLLMMVAQVTGYKPGVFVHTLGDAHLYLNHRQQARLQLARDPYPPPRMHLNPAVTSIFDFKYEDFRLEAYRYHPHIKAPIAV